MSDSPKKLHVGDLPGWVLEEITPIIASRLDDEAAERALRASLHGIQDWLVKHGTTPALFAKELMRQRPRP